MTFAREKVCTHAACDVSPADLRRRTLPIPCLTLSGKPCTTASGGRLQADDPSPAAPPDRSPVLGVAVSALVRLARGAGVCPAPHRIAWQRQRFRDHWRRLSQQGTPGRPAIAKELRELIRTMWQANPTWGSPRIVGELRKLGIDVATSTVEKYRPRSRKSPSPTWKTFLKTHMKDVVALDFFMVPTVTFRVLFVLVILTHDRRRIVQVNVTEHPTAQWTAQQVVEACPWDEAPRYLLRDRDRIYGPSFSATCTTYGHQGSTDCPLLAVAEPLCRATHRQYPARVFGACDSPP